VGGKGGGGGRGEKWTKPCMHIWIIKEKWKKKKFACGKLVNKKKKHIWEQKTPDIPACYFHCSSSNHSYWIFPALLCVPVSVVCPEDRAGGKEFLCLCDFQKISKFPIFINAMIEIRDEEKSEI
jgi:hypothetical protein